MTHIVRASAPFFCAILILAGCAELNKPAQPPICPSCAPCAACAVPAAAAEAKYQQTPFTAIAGWPSAPLAAGPPAVSPRRPPPAAGAALRRAPQPARPLPPAAGGPAR